MIPEEVGLEIIAEIDAFNGLRTIADDIAETDDFIYVLRLDIGQNGLERRQVLVNVRDDRFHDPALSSEGRSASSSSMTGMSSRIGKRSPHLVQTICSPSRRTSTLQTGQASISSSSLSIMSLPPNGNSCPVPVVRCPIRSFYRAVGLLQAISIRRVIS